MPAAPAMAAALSQPVTPPMRMKSGITKSQALLLQRLVQLARAVEVLADLDRRLQLGGELGIAVEIVVDDRLLDPGEAKIVDRVAALQGLGEVQALVEVDHQVHVVADRLADGVDRREIVARVARGRAAA